MSLTLGFSGCGEKNSNEEENKTPVYTTSKFNYAVNISPSPSALRAGATKEASSGSIPSQSVYAVKGLDVRCKDDNHYDKDAIYSITDENGTFDHREGDDCVFTITQEYTVIRGRPIGEIHIEHGGIVTPQGLTSTVYTNTLRLLYSLDNDQNRSNGIDLTGNNDVSPFNFDTDDFDTAWDNWSKWVSNGDYIAPAYFPPVSEAEVLGTINNPITGVLKDTRFTFSGVGSFQFHNNGALTHVTSEKSDSDIVGGVWSLTNGIITVHFIDNTDSFHLVPSSLPLDINTTIHHQELNEDTTVIDIETF